MKTELFYDRLDQQLSDAVNNLLNEGSLDYTSSKKIIADEINAFAKETSVGDAESDSRLLIEKYGYLLKIREIHRNEQIANDVRIIKYWTIFFGALTIIGIAIWWISLLTA